jgi:PAS domain S-box-containing protein
MNNWLENQTVALRVWVAKMPHALLVSRADGSILYSNEACEKLLGYTTVELEQKDWRELTVDPADLRSDLAMVEAVMSGERVEYEQQKSYRHKLGHPIDCFIHVHRYPLHGDSVDFFLVSIRPATHAGQQEIMNNLLTMRSAMLEQLEAFGSLIEAMLATKKTAFEQVMDWAGKNKKAATILGFFLAYILFGDRAFEVAERAIRIFRGGD